MDAQMEEALKNLRTNNFDARFAENSDTAKKIVSGSISKNTIVGIGDSATVRQIGIIEELEEKRIRVLNPFSRELTTDHAKTVARAMIVFRKSLNREFEAIPRVLEEAPCSPHVQIKVLWPK